MAKKITCIDIAKKIRERAERTGYRFCRKCETELSIDEEEIIELLKNQK